jgi:hypothetical protein
MRLSHAYATFSVFLTIMMVESVAVAAPRQQGTNVKEGECELVSVGNYYCKVNGKCYYCTKSDKPDPNKDCYKETTCDPAVTRPGTKGTVRPPMTTQPPIMRRGVEGEQPTSSEKEGK